MKYSFKSYAQKRHRAPEADRLLPIISASGRVGMNRGQIGSAVKLDRDILDELLDGLVQIGMLTISWEIGSPVYRSVG